MRMYDTQWNEIMKDRRKEMVEGKCYKPAMKIPRVKVETKNHTLEIRGDSGKDQVKITSASEFTSRDGYFMQVILMQRRRQCLFSGKWHGIQPWSRG